MLLNATNNRHKNFRDVLGNGFLFQSPYLRAEPVGCKHEGKTNQRLSISIEILKCNQVWNISTLCRYYGSVYCVLVLEAALICCAHNLFCISPGSLCVTNDVRYTVRQVANRISMKMMYLNYFFDLFCIVSYETNHR